MTIFLLSLAATVIVIAIVWLINFRMAQYIHQRLDKIIQQAKNENLLYCEQGMLHTESMETPAVITILENELQIVPIVGAKLIIPIGDIQLLSGGQWYAYSKFPWWGKSIVKIKDIRSGESYLLGIKNKKDLMKFFNETLAKK